ncbi:MAG: MFS transporter [Pseudomonadota bacterium]
MAAEGERPDDTDIGVSVAPLLIGVGLLMLGNGLQGSLLGLRAAAEGFSNAVIGIVMASFFAGFLVGAIWAVSVVQRVGHIRGFAAFASIASVSILAHGVFVEPIFWSALRFVTGICFAGIFVVAESWLNSSSSNQNRGQLLSVYMFTSFAGMGAGQLLLNLSSPESINLFILVSVLISFSVVPMLLNAAPPPNAGQTGEDPSLPGVKTVKRVFTASPLGVVGTFTAGIINGAVFGMGAVYALERGFSVTGASLFMGVIIAGSALLQWPIGKLSDTIDRRVTITLISVAAAGLAVMINLFGEGGWFWSIAFLFGGASLSLHTLSIAYTNDYLEPTEMVGASGVLVLVLGFGSILGPLVAGLAIENIGPTGYFFAIAGVHIALSAFAVWRMFQRAALDQDDQGPYISLPSATSSVAIEAAEEAHADQLSDGR